MALEDRSPTALDLLAAEFARMVGGAHPPELEAGFLGHGLPSSAVRLDGLSAVLWKKAPSWAARDAVCAELVRRARSGDDRWQVALAGVLLPGLRRMAARLAREYCSGHEEVADSDAELVTGFLDAVATLELDGGHLPARLCWAAYHRVRKVRDAARRDRPLGRQVAAPQQPPEGHPDLVLARAVREGVISPFDAEVIGTHRIDGVDLRTLAESCGLTFTALRQRRLRAERRLAEWLIGQDQVEGVVTTRPGRRRGSRRKRATNRNHAGAVARGAAVLLAGAPTSFSSTSSVGHGRPALAARVAFRHGVRVWGCGAGGHTVPRHLPIGDGGTCHEGESATGSLRSCALLLYGRPDDDDRGGGRRHGTVDQRHRRSAHMAGRHPRHAGHAVPDSGGGQVPGRRRRSWRDREGENCAPVRRHRLRARRRRPDPRRHPAVHPQPSGDDGMRHAAIRTAAGVLLALVAALLGAATIGGGLPHRVAASAAAATATPVPTPPFDWGPLPTLPDAPPTSATPAPSSIASPAPSASPGGISLGPPPIGTPPASAQPPSSSDGSGSDGSSGNGCSWWDVPCHIGDAINGWLASLVGAVLNPILDLLGHTLLSTPDVSTSPRVRDIWHMTLGIANAGFVLFVVIGGAIVMGYETVHSRYALKDIAPRLVFGLISANASLALVGLCIGAGNALSQALMGEGIGQSNPLLANLVLIRAAMRAPSMFLVILGIVLAVLGLVLLCTYIIRVCLVVFLTVAAPMVLALHALPQTEGIARIWWRALTACMAIQLAQSLVLITAVRVILGTGSQVGVFGIGGQLVDVLVTICLFWMLARIPFWTFRFVLAGSHQRSSVLRIAKYALIYKLVKRVKTVATSAAAAA